jgi:predicted O-methyltransferase YrrM
MILGELRKYIWKVRQLPRGSYDLVSVIRNYPRWKATVNPGRNPLADGMPWMTFDAIRYLKKYLTREMRVFEYGMGGSTIFFSTLAAEVISVEHDEKWFASARSYFQERGIKNCTPVFIAPGTAPAPGDPADPDACASADKTYRAYSFHEYVESIDAYPDACFDLVVIDGRARPSCIKHSVSKVKRGGLILLDNADRAHYQRAIRDYLTGDFTDALAAFGPTAYSWDFTQTLIRIKN